MYIYICVCVYVVLESLLRHVVSLNDENCIKMINFNGRRARDPLPEITKICVFKAVKAILPRLSIFAMDLQNSLIVKLFILTSTNHRISLKWCQ